MIDKELELLFNLTIFLLKNGFSLLTGLQVLCSIRRKLIAKGFAVFDLVKSLTLMSSDL